MLRVAKRLFWSGILIFNWKCPNHVYGDLCHNMRPKSKHRLVFYSFIVIWSLIVSEINPNCILFRSDIQWLIATIWKCPDFLPEMSGILDTSIPTYFNSGQDKASYTQPRLGKVKYQTLNQQKRMWTEQGTTFRFLQSGDWPSYEQRYKVQRWEKYDEAAWRIHSRDQPWHFDSIPKQTISKLMQEKGQIGDFIIRESSTYGH